MFKFSSLSVSLFSSLFLFHSFLLSLTAKGLFCLISLSWSMTQCMPLSLMGFESWMCCEANLPFLRKITFTHKNSMQIAIINRVNMRSSVIFY